MCFLAFHGWPGLQNVRSCSWFRVAFPLWWGCPVCSSLVLCISLYAHIISLSLLSSLFLTCARVWDREVRGDTVFFFSLLAAKWMWGVRMVSGWLKKPLMLCWMLVTDCLLTATFLSERHWLNSWSCQWFYALQCSVQCLVSYSVRQQRSALDVSF